ncbi:hypothetical protein QR680_017079 [Steinernema hermaphroditum]|uniref:Secreted protein n=1 Tax=Steinernema hermaphroditum TaxID=289476 RepID=A0AA39HF91_9BILA|nr:hypothetical protein QR680_017079 [Steinernema hermaphroditum]
MLSAQLTIACLLVVLAIAYGHSNFVASDSEDSAVPVEVVPLPYGFWQAPQQLVLNTVEDDDAFRPKRSKWASQIRYGKRASWASQVRFG